MSYNILRLEHKRKWSDARHFYESGKASPETAADWTGLPLKEVQAYYAKRLELS